MASKMHPPIGATILTPPSSSRPRTMISILSSMLAYQAPAAPAGAVSRAAATGVRMESLADLKDLATKLNPAVKYWDPLNLASRKFLAPGWESEAETIGWLRHSEIKHGRVAMAAFIGYCVQANGIKFPWAPFDQITATSPPEQWDALSDVQQWQIILGVGFLEWWSEIRVDGTPHYMKGGKPGYFPPFDGSGAPIEKLPHPVGLNLWDPFKFTKGMSAERKQSALVAEVNNGRLAMLGIMGFLSEVVPCAVPLLNCVMRNWIRGDGPVHHVSRRAPKAPPPPPAAAHRPRATPLTHRTPAAAVRSPGTTGLSPGSKAVR